jgi:hypothetical protein
MDSLGIKSFTARNFEQHPKDMAADFGSTGHTGNPEMVSAACNFYVEATFDLSQVLVELSAKIGETAVVGGLQDEFLGYLYGVQGLAVRPLRLMSKGAYAVFRLLTLDYIDTC